MSTTEWTIDWKGDEVLTKVLNATRRGIDRTMAQAVGRAKPATPVRTGILQGSIDMRPSAITGTSVEGTWGSFDVNYALWVEVGTSRMSGRHMMRRAADAEYPKLISRIKSEFQGLGG